MSEQHPFLCNLCDALCGLRVTVEDGRVTAIRGDPDDPFSRGHICPKGPALRELREDPDRLRQPMRRTATGWEPVSWDEALSEAAARLLEVRARHGRHAVGLYIGNPVVHSHRLALGAGLLQAVLATHNHFDPNSQDGNPRLFACMQMYGDGLSMPVPDVDRTDYLLLIGANPAASNGSMWTMGDPRGRLRALRSRGGRIVLVDPRRNETAREYATEHHFIRPGSDAAFLLGLLHALFAERRVDEERVMRVASGLPDLRALAMRFPPERVAHATGIAASTIRRLAGELSRAPRACVYGRIGTSQNLFGPVATWLIEALNVVTGNLDREGGAMFPEPAADVAPLARLLIGNNYARWRSRVRGLPELFAALPSAVMAEEMETPGEGQIRAFVCVSGNPVLSTPGGERLARALGRLDFMVAVDFYLNETSRLANVVLPPGHVFETGNYNLFMLGFAVRNFARYSSPIVAAPPGTRDDWEILGELAVRIRLGNSDRAARAFRRWGRGFPERAIDLMLRTGVARTSLARLRAESRGIDLGPLRPAFRRKVRTPDGRVRLAPRVLMDDVARLEKWLDAPRDGGLVLIGRRSLRSNNSWMHNVPSLAKGPDRARLLMHADDAAARGLVDGARVRVSSRTGSVTARLAVTEDIMPGVVSLPHGFGHGEAAGTLRVAGALEGPSANALTDAADVEPVLGTSVLNGVPVSVEPAP
jgi:anaerobic selenocysteine-containing dehydrogenase